jgi:hypothetical protein
MNPKDAFTWNALGLAYKKNGQGGNCIDVYRQLKTLDPAMAEKFYNSVFR